MKKVAEVVSKVAKVKASTQAKKSVSTKKRTSVAATPVNQVQSLTYEQILRKSESQKEEQQLQYACVDNLSTLSDSIEKTARELDKTRRYRETMLDTTNVDWKALAEKDQQIEGYEKGLNRLKEYRNRLFPTWKAIRVQD